jgi:hypothetical protein
VKVKVALKDYPEKFTTVDMLVTITEPKDTICYCSVKELRPILKQGKYLKEIKFIKNSNRDRYFQVFGSYLQTPNCSKKVTIKVKSDLPNHVAYEPDSHRLFVSYKVKDDFEVEF